MGRGAVWVSAAIAIVPLSVGLGQTFAAGTAAPPPMSGMTVNALAVSPAYMRTGVIVATGAPVKTCTSACERLMVSRDHGDTWQQAAATGWKGGRPVITVDRDGHEVLF